MVGCCKPLGVGILCSCCCPLWSGHDASINLQQEKCYSLFCDFLSLYELKSVIPLKVRALRMGSPVCFGLISNILNLKQKKQNTKVKETDPIWSHIWSSLLYYYFGSFYKQEGFSFWERAQGSRGKSMCITADQSGWKQEGTRVQINSQEIISISI